MAYRMMTKGERAVVRAGQYWTDERADEMRALPEDVRRDLIDAGENVLGFDRFQHRSKQVLLRSAYRKSQNPAPGGKA
jgi:hypothetical protein